MPRKRAGYMSMCHTPNYTAPKPTAARTREGHREDGRLDAMDVCFGEEATREPFVHITKKTRTKKPMTPKQIEKRYGEGYTPEIVEAAKAGYREGYERYMREYGICDCTGYAGQSIYCRIHHVGGGIS